MNIYQISNELKEIITYLEEEELTPEIENQLVVAQKDLQKKAVDYGYAIKSIQGESDLISEEIKRLQAIKKVRENTITRLKDTVKDAMVRFGIDQVKTPTINLSVRDYPSVEIINDAELDRRFITVKTTEAPDKTAIKKAIERGETVTGAVLNFNPSLIIK